MTGTIRFTIRVGFILLVASTTSFGQSQKIDSLESLVSSLKGAKKVDALNKLAFELFPFDEEKFLETITEAVKLSDEHHYPKGKIEALIYLAAHESDIGENEKSIEDLKKCVSLSSAIADNQLKGFALKQLGATFQNLDQWDSSFYYFKQSYELLKDSLNPLYLSIVYIGLADYYGFKNQYKNQLNYLKRSFAIRKTFSGTSRVWIAIGLASFYSNQEDFKMAFEYLDDAQRNLGKDTIQNELISAINSQRAMAYFKQGNYEKALKLLNEARKFYALKGYTKELTNLLISTGQAFDNTGNYEASLKNYFEALPLASTGNFKFELAKLQYSIAWSYFRLRQYKTAEVYAHKAIESSQKNNHQSDLASSLNVMGLISESQNRDDEAFSYLTQALKIREELKDSLKIAATFFNIGTLYEKTGNLKAGMDFQLRSLSIQVAHHNLMGMAYSFQRCGGLYIKLHQFEKANQYLDKAEDISRTIKTRNILADVYDSKRELYEAQANIAKALFYSKKSQRLRDSVFDESLGNRIGVLENAYQLEEKENRIQILSQQTALQESKITIQNSQIRQQQTIIWSSIGGILIICVAASILFMTNKRIRQLNFEVQEKNEEISAQTEELTESNQTISQMNQQLEGQIEIRTSELKQAYKELDIFFYRSSHDFRRPLTTLMGLAEVAKITVKDSSALELFEKVNETAHSLDRMLFKLQSISDVGIQGLHYSEVNIKDIFYLEIDSFQEELKKSQIKIDIDVLEEQSFYSYPSLIRIIIKNLLENAIAFRNKSNPEIILRSYNKAGEIFIEVQDNGQGIRPEYIDRAFEMYFRANEKSKGNGLGLYIVKKTVQKLNGTVDIASEFDIGTTVRVVIPKENS